MASQRRLEKLQNEGRLLLAVNAIKKSQVSSVRKAASVFNVPETSLRHRLSGRASRVESRAYNRKLEQSEEQTLTQWILSMDARGYAPKISAVRDAALILLAERVGRADAHIGKNWATNFVNNEPALKGKWTRKYDYKRAKCEDPALIRAWFELVADTIAKYGIAKEDIYNFDETGFALGVACTSRVVTGSDRRSRPRQVQPGDREWVTAIEAVNASGWALPPMVIFKAKRHIASWYQNDLPHTWLIGVSDNGWTTNELGFSWLQKLFQPYTAPRTVGKYRLLILDGHSSHATPEFDHFCAENSIITLCMPPHSSHLLQPLDVGCFSPLKKYYGQLVADCMAAGINHIDKDDFLPMFTEARTRALSENNIQSGFAAAGLVPLTPEEVLSRLPAMPETPLEATPQSSQQSLITPQNVMQLQRQATTIKRLIKRRSKSPPTPTDVALNKLVKGCALAMQSAALLASENEKLRAANQRQAKKRHTSRTQLSRGGTLTRAEAEELIRQPEAAPGVVETSTRLEAPQTVQARLPKCMKCYSENHTTRSCSRA
jgi:hypothetical protein